MKKPLFCLLTVLTPFLLLESTPAGACTNFIVTRGASTDSTTLVSYSADSHALYGCLYKFNAPKGGFRPGEMLSVYEWDTGCYLGDIPQVEHPYSTVGNMNEHSLIITETTYGGRGELADSTGRMDYGSMIYITLQRARTAREAIRVMADLADTYGYASEGESFSIADADEAWIMEVIGKGFEPDGKGGNARKGIVWVARRIPDGYVSGHANQARITTFPLDDPDNCLYSPDVISFAREMGYYEGPDAEFSFCDAYAPADFSALRACEARVWSFFRRVADGMDAYTDYAMGHNPANRMPLWVKPSKKVSPKEVFDAMRDHYEGTPMDMTRDLGAGGCGLSYRWRPMSFEVDGTEYINERATATQQTGFWLVAQANRAAGDSVVRRRRCRHVVSYADLLLDRSRARMSERKQRVDVEVFPHVDVLALQSRHEFRLPALRPHVEGFAGGSRSVGESGARRGARGHGRGAETRRGGAREVRDRLFGDDGPDLVRSVEADGRIFAGEVHRRQCEGRDRTWQIQG